MVNRCTHDIINPPPPKWVIKKLEIILQTSPHRRESFELLIRLPRLGFWHQGDEPQSIWLWRPARLDCRSSTGMGKERLHSLRVHIRPVHIKTHNKSSDFTGARSRLIQWSWRVPWRAEEWLWLILGSRMLMAELSVSIHWNEFS